MSSLPSFSHIKNTRRLEEVITLHPHDVVIGCYGHNYPSGNIWYREMILRYHVMYNSSPKDIKLMIAIKIVQSLSSFYQQLPRGRFLSFSLQSKHWIVFTNEQAVKETMGVLLQCSTNLQVPSNSRQRVNYNDITCTRPSPMEIFHYQQQQQQQQQQYGLSPQSRYYHPQQQHQQHQQQQQQQKQQQPPYPLPPRLQPPRYHSRNVHPNQHQHQHQHQHYQFQKPVQQLHQSLHQQHSHNYRYCQKPEQQLQNQRQVLQQHRGHKKEEVTKAGKRNDDSEDTASMIIIDLCTEDDFGGNEKEDGDTQKETHQEQKTDDGRKVKHNENITVNTGEISTLGKSVINLLEDSEDEDEEDGEENNDEDDQKDLISNNGTLKNQVLQCTSVDHINDQQNQEKRISSRESKDDGLSFDDDEDDDDDVVIVEKLDRFVECQTKDDNDRKYNNQDNDDDVDIRIIGSTGNNALADFAHSREDCVIYPFSSKDPKVCCPKCYCYVCDIKASDCTKWDIHCQAKRNEIKWTRQRSKVRNKRKAPQREIQRLGTTLLLASTSDKNLQTIKRPRREILI
jgi:hypothetical protein